MMRSISPVRAVHSRISSRWGVGSRPSTRLIRASSEWNRGTSSFWLERRARSRPDRRARARRRHRPGQGDGGRIVIRAASRGGTCLQFGRRGGKVCARSGDVAQNVSGEGPKRQ